MLKIVVFAIIIATAFGLPKIHKPLRNGRVVGGEETTIEEYPYAVSLLYIESHICGGSIVDEDTIVTAAHCTYETDHTYWQVRAGSTIKNSGGIVVDVTTIIEHPFFNSVELLSDIAVLKLATPLIYDETMQPIPLQHFEVWDDTPCQLTGWGRQSDGGLPSRKLRVATVPIVNHEVCNRIYNGLVSDTSICAGYLEEGGVDACDGDSGSPLNCEGELAGIVSWGIGCAEPGHPGVYTNVFEFQDFIQENL